MELSIGENVLPSRVKPVDYFAASAFFLKVY
jgi:hypothetical protein